MPRHIDTRDIEEPHSEMPLSEIGDPGPIEPIAENDFTKAASLEAFMCEMLVINVHQTAEDGSLDVITPNVNGVNQPIIRGRDTKVKRKYVEALARSRTPRMRQAVPDPTRPENIMMVEDQALSYPFSVIHDPNPKGAAWLSSILNQRV